MASLSLEGFDQLEDGLERIAQIPADVKGRAIRTGGEVVEFHTQKTGMQYGVNRTGDTLASMALTGETITGEGGHIDITFKGTNRDGNRHAEVAYVNNFGVARTNLRKRSQAARPFVDDAAEESADEAAESAADILFAYIEANL